MKAQRTVLIVDDSPTICRLVTTTLQKQGYQVYAATDGMDALAKMNEHIPSLILLDITMPRLDGYQLCRIIKSNKDLRNTPVVMLSGKDGLLDKVKGRMAGASDYITKPFNPNALVKTVRKHVTP
jgi:twitching motility two-component system response regulator PilG